MHRPTMRYLTESAVSRVTCTFCRTIATAAHAPTTMPMVASIVAAGVCGLRPQTSATTTPPTEATTRATTVENPRSTVTSNNDASTYAATPVERAIAPIPSGDTRPQSGLSTANPMSAIHTINASSVMTRLPRPRNTATPQRRPRCPGTTPSASWSPRPMWRPPHRDESRANDLALTGEPCILRGAPLPAPWSA